MSYRIEITCDVQGPRCVSRGGMSHPDRPFGESGTVEGAKIQVKIAARDRGWTERRQPGRSPSVAAICPGCQS